MASLPAQHPRLALHLTDRALTPLISSSPSSLTSTSQQQQQQQQQPHSNPNRKPSYPSKRPPVFSTSPPSDDDGDLSSSPSSSSPTSSTSSPTSATTAAAAAARRSEEEPALTNLTSTALSAYDAAKRLGKGAPLRTMVEYPDAGLVVLHSYMCPMSLTLGTPGRKASSDSLHTAAGVVHHAFEESTSTTTLTTTAGANGDAAEGQQARAGTSAAGGVSRTDTPRRPLSSGLDPLYSDGDGDGDDDNDEVEAEEGESPNAPPMLIGTVVAPRAEDLREARRAAGRLERIARVFQTEWVVEGDGVA